MSVTVQQAWSPANIERDNQNTNNASASVYFIAFDAANEAEALSAVDIPEEKKIHLKAYAESLTGRKK